MSIDELLKGVKIEWKPLGDIGAFINGSGMPKSMFDENGQVGAIHYGHIYTKYQNFVYEPIVKISEKNAEKLKKVQKGDLVIAKTSENLDDVMKTVAYLGDEEVVAGGHSAIFKHNQNPKYLTYIFNGSSNLIMQKNRLARGTKVIELSAKHMEKIRIPIPPLEIQEKIVEIIDGFTRYVNGLTAELTAELTARKKQYAYYRDMLLSEEYLNKLSETLGNEGETNDKVIWTTLGEVAKFKYGFTTTAKDIGNYRFLRITDITENGILKTENAKFVNDDEVDEDYLVGKDDVLMARTGATYGKTLYISEKINAVYASFLIKIDTDKEKLSSRYYWHFAQSGDYWKQADFLAKGGGQPQFNANVLKKVKLPIPSLAIQAHVVSILDIFDKLTSDITQGLLKEIELRKKQYVYYREKLLAFECGEKDV
ncbi:restriction endonuclease subunit S [Bacillus cereus]|uniref:restriction endonuclease subunit S n=1 Tax=Bacillus cereus TaxID=1396 RepID=UPI00016B894D|nr:restriction endonuclease subunit S [Bacillus cereus]EDX70105.1 type I restriction-modification system specificity determinant [Bacillus cereus NVH0597-99]MDA2470995.1 restriction endonuclease subunit S [Bacillus cereus]MDE7544540.1 restriction endonuclease subunit S [Bacillus cereus]OOZ95945.1 hypothetical protein BHL27_24075 [Bacillus cereus]